MAKITVLHHTPMDVLVKATAMPYQSKESKGLVKRVFDSNHRSVVRHGMASFLVEGVSQSLLRQISRHSHLNLTVKSTRYCDMQGADIYVPNKIVKNTDDYNQYLYDMGTIMKIYSKWKNEYEGDEKEVDVAKLFLPLASTTDLVVSANYQGWYEFLQLRNCVRSEEEIRKLSLELTKILKGLIPEIFGELDCRGKQYGICPEFKSCGKYPTKKELIIGEK